MANSSPFELKVTFKSEGSTNKQELDDTYDFLFSRFFKQR